MARADSGQLLWEFAVGTLETNAGDPFCQWLRDDQPVVLDWSAFGIAAVDPPRPLP